RPGQAAARPAGGLAQGAQGIAGGPRRGRLHWRTPFPRVKEPSMHRHPCGGSPPGFLKAARTLAPGLRPRPHLGWAGEVPPAKAADVGIARGSNMEEAVRRAVRLAGGMDFIKEGQTVLIKPNVTGALKSPTTTNPEVLYATIKLVAERGPKRILVSDRCFSAQFIETAPKTIDVMK